VVEQRETTGGPRRDGFDPGGVAEISRWLSGAKPPAALGRKVKQVKPRFSEATILPNISVWPVWLPVLPICKKMIDRRPPRHAL
jgi:hypothetical protein